MPWEDVRYVVESLDHPQIAEFLTAIAGVYVNGGIILRSFRATNENEFDRAAANDFRGRDLAYHTFLKSPEVNASIPDLEIVSPFRATPEFQWMSLFGMEGELTHDLLVGGAYERFQGTVEQARSLSRRFLEALFGSELQIGSVARSWTPWTAWFHDVAWDCTFVIRDDQRRRFVLLCMTDTD